MTEQEYKKGLFKGFWTVLNCNRKLRNRRPNERRTNVTPAQKVLHSIGILAWNVPLAQMGQMQFPSSHLAPREVLQSRAGIIKAMEKQQKRQQVI